jgi:hypothetical protein
VQNNKSVSQMQLNKSASQSPFSLSFNQKLRNILVSVDLQKSSHVSKLDVRLHSIDESPDQ